jgi:hypothetical protein
LEEGDLVLKEMVSQSAVEWKVRLGGWGGLERLSLFAQHDRDFGQLWSDIGGGGGGFNHSGDKDLRLYTRTQND